MPPKRKLKATKTATSSLLKGPPAASSGSQAMQAKRRNSLQGGKSRLAPSTPLHMTTRRAAKTASNHNSSGAPSLASSGSRRSSLNDIAQFEHGPSDNEDAPSAKRPRLSTDSGSPQRSTASDADQNTVNGTQTPELSKPASQPVSDGPKPSSRKRRASDESTQSSKTVSARTNGVLARAQGDSSEQQPRRKKRKTTQTPAESADQPPELTDASTAPNSPEPENAGVESSQNLLHVLPTNGDAPAKLGRRLPGRRRAPHPDINVETDLRRQLNLKMNYRSLAKLQKNILEELSNRATNSLENDPGFYKRCPEYEPLMAGLDRHRDGRLYQINTLRTEKLAQLERVRIATEHIETEKYIQRFKDLQEDLLLQCFYRMKQIQREIKGANEEATDDEDNVIAPTHVDFPTVGDDDRLGSKFASRSRAYVETERLLDEDLIRKRFDQQRQVFVANDEDADDSIEDAGGFATFIGPDRTEAIAHWNIMSLVDAATDVESTPIPPPPPKIINNEDANALFLLAQLSADAPRGSISKQHQDEKAALPTELHRAPSPVHLPPSPAAIAISDPITAFGETSLEQQSRNQTPQHQETNGLRHFEEQIPPKNETPARSTHRIMDMLNTDAEVPVPHLRAVREQTPAAASSRRLSPTQGATPSRSGLPGLDSMIHRQEPPSKQSTSGFQPSLPPPSEAPPLSPSTNRYAPDWPTRLPSLMPGNRDRDEILRKKDPLNAIRAMLDAKALAEGRLPPSMRPDNPDNMRKAAAERERAPMGAPLLSRPFSPSGAHGRDEVAGKDARRPSAGGYSAPPSTQPQSYTQSPTIAPSHPRFHHSSHNSQDAASSQWDRSRSHSGSQAPQSYADSPQPFQPEPNRTNAPPHQSPYATSSAPQLPSISSSLPPKPSGPPASNSVNYRFAHYDPAPPRQPTYPSSNTAAYPSASYPPHYGPPLPTHYGGPTSYSGPPAFHSGYVPPPGSFQAPPPPTSAMSPYPPLKIHQYGGQPILPANMAPPPPHSQPPPYMSQPPQGAYSPPQQQSISSRNPSLDQESNASRDAPGDRSSESQNRQRRQYRSYHAPGTQFRSYQGPDSGRRRG